MKVLFVYLSAFSSNGGIQRYNKCFMQALETFYSIKYLHLISQNDQNANNLKGFKGQKLKFFVASIFASFNSDIIILGHINLAPLYFAIKLFRPKSRFLLITHGIDVWRPLSFLQRKVIQKVDKVFTVSAFSKKMIEERHQVPSSKISIVYNTIDPDYTPPVDFKKKPVLAERYKIKDELLLLTVCRISTTEIQKGYDKVIHLLPKLKEKGFKVKYLLVGKYEKEEHSRLQKLISGLNLNNEVILTGAVSDEELLDHYLLADIFIMPSQKEGFGIVFIEAMLCGLTVIAGNKDGSRDALLNGKLGILVNPDELEDIQKGVLEAIELVKVKSVKEKYAQQQKVLDTFGFEQFKINIERELKDLAGE